MSTVVITSGGFDPLHVGHVRYLKEAKKLGGMLIVIVNGDSLLIRKKGYKVMPIEDRCEILVNLDAVDTSLYPLNTHSRGQIKIIIQIF